MKRWIQANWMKPSLFLLDVTGTVICGWDGRLHKKVHRDDGNDLADVNDVPSLFLFDCILTAAFALLSKKTLFDSFIAR